MSLRPPDESAPTGRAAGYTEQGAAASIPHGPSNDLNAASLAGPIQGACDSERDPEPRLQNMTSSMVPVVEAVERRGKYNVPHVIKIPTSVRVPLDVVDLIDTACREAARRGERLTRDEAVSRSVRAFWGKKKRPSG